MAMTDKPSILIVEDNSANLRLAHIALTKCGYQVATAETAEEAIHEIDNLKPDIILMDLQLPGMDGLQLTTEIKRHTATQSIVIIAITAYTRDLDKEKAMKAGCDGYITKPYDALALPGLIEAIYADKKPAS